MLENLRQQNETWRINEQNKMKVLVFSQIAHVWVTSCLIIIYAYIVLFYILVFQKSFLCKFPGRATKLQKFDDE